MFLRLATLPPTLLVGQCVTMSCAADQTSALWRAFRARRPEIAPRPDATSWSVQGYGAARAAGTFDGQTVFEKWAAVEVTAATAVPERMHTLALPGGLYAVFEHVGPASEFARTARLIYGDWLPTSGYILDDRDHFERFADTYWPLDADAREEIWVPVRVK